MAYIEAQMETLDNEVVSKKIICGKECTICKENFFPIKGHGVQPIEKCRYVEGLEFVLEEFGLKHMASIGYGGEGAVVKIKNPVLLSGLADGFYYLRNMLDCIFKNAEKRIKN